MTPAGERTSAGRPLRIAILVHSTNPRGGVVHGLELAEALTDLGHDAVLHAPDPRGAGLFRPARCATVPVTAAPAPAGDLPALVAQRIGEIAGWFTAPGQDGFDLYHAQDSISANALALLQRRGRIAGFVRTVHHLDDFADPRLAAWQRHGVTAAGRLLCVSRHWQRRLADQFGRAVALVSNGVDTGRFTPRPDPDAVHGDAALRRRLGLGPGPVFLAVGGVEARKNTLTMLDGFSRLRRRWPDAQLVIAGGASLLDHSDYQQRFDAALAALAVPADGPAPVIRTGPLAQPDMPALYRLADALAFCSLREGFGLAVLEAMASGVPAVVSRIAPFTDYLGADDCLWADPGDPDSIATALAASLDPARRPGLIRRGQVVAGRFPWPASARRHLALYRAFLETGDAGHGQAQRHDQRHHPAPEPAHA